MQYSLGIDPGWASCGLAVYSKPGILFKASYIPRNHGGNIKGFIEKLEKDFLDHSMQLGTDPIFDTVTIERYVAYKGIHSDASEAILMLIGALNYYFEDKGSTIHMVRAIDWKPKICKYLVRAKGFDNPYPNFDKRFSLLAAKTLSGLELDTDHEADAICLSYLGEVDQYNLQREKEKKNVAKSLLEF